MLDIRFIRENPDLVKENLKRKNKEDRLVLVDQILEKYEKSIQIKKEAESLRHKRNELSLEINELVKQKKDASKIIKQVREVPEKIKSLEETKEKIDLEIAEHVSKIPNIMHKSVPLGKDETKNKVIKKWGKIPNFKFPIKNHVELGESLGLMDFESSAKTSGNGFYYLKGDLALLNQALVRFTIDFMKKKKYTYIEPPLMVSKKVAAAAGDLNAFKLALYKIENEDYFMIPTAEHAVLGMLSNQTTQENKLPLKFFAYSMCFRKEIGSHGINEKGLWRTHQFNKVEQFIFCHPKDSWKYYEELRKNSEEIWQKLKIPYRVLEMCSGDLGDWKAKSEDIEAYRPTTKDYGEVGSLSNCTDFQARDLDIKLVDKNGEKLVLHTLNNTALATSRALVVIMENYQQKDGSIKVPTVLQQYMGKLKVIKKT
ncbi:serine--tRNA ligase [Candidatus Woesearchaeota archaeon]|nr:serine--tRNA ligase [Candidatus Woesearchaeota archaeon]